MSRNPRQLSVDEIQSAFQGLQLAEQVTLMMNLQKLIDQKKEEVKKHLALLESLEPAVG